MSTLNFTLPFCRFELTPSAEANRSLPVNPLHHLFENRLLNLGSIQTQLGFDLLNQDFTIRRDIYFPVYEGHRDLGMVPVELKAEAIERHILGLGYDTRMNRLTDQDRMTVDQLRTLEFTHECYACISAGIQASPRFWLSVLPLGRKPWEGYRTFPVMRNLDALASRVLGTPLSQAQLPNLIDQPVGLLAAVTGFATIMIEFARIRQAASELLRGIQERGLERLLVQDTSTSRGKSAMLSALMQLQKDLSLLSDFEAKLASGDLADIDWRGGAAFHIEGYRACLRLWVFTLFVLHRSAKLTRRIASLEVEALLSLMNGLHLGLTQENINGAQGWAGNY